MSSEEDFEDFQFWLMDMDDAIDRLFSLLPAEVENHLDYSATSLNYIESWILNKYPDTADIIKESEKEVLDGLSRYVGETFRMAFKGKWTIPLDDPDYAYYGMPMVAIPHYNNSICPVTLVTASADRRVGNYISTVFNNIKKSKK
ncbi:hypothetical protein ACFQ49_02080 [Kroppenstedtia eburnea]|uniref:hypothetical protein n=1 Tax=Kroppenstedtia eburnea TaxID=714067 RepID=UPI00020C8041|nr:hypothetical protein HMPREF9374_1487 [Desmospora sp. 8437]